MVADEGLAEAENDQMEVVRMLLEAEADKHAAPADGSTALMATALDGHLVALHLFR